MTGHDAADHDDDDADLDASTQARDMRILDNARAALAEHFDTVTILVTRASPDGCTVGADRGSGNWYARVGHVRDWLLKCDERTRREVAAEDD